MDIGEIMSLKRKIGKLRVYFLKFDVLKTLYWRQRLHLPRSASFHICPRSIVDIDKEAAVKIESGELVVNDSWFNTRRRQYVSELRLNKGSTFVCEGDFKLYQGSSIYVGPGAKLVLHGGGSFLNTHSTLNCFHHIEIGKDCSISDYVNITDSDAHFFNGNRDSMNAPVIIEDHVWIGKNVIILKGVKIGSGAVVGAGSVVTKDVDRNTVVAGNPAKFIKRIESWR